MLKLVFVYLWILECSVTLVLASPLEVDSHGTLAPVSLIGCQQTQVGAQVVVTGVGQTRVVLESVEHLDAGGSLQLVRHNSRLAASELVLLV